MSGVKGCKLGQSKIPFFVYVDESGNTGKNIFDASQPDYYTAALITKGRFDEVYGVHIREIAAKVGATCIHANELGLGRIETIAADLCVLLTRADVKFFVARVEKKYLLATKVFDVLFDSGENAAVAWHSYNFKLSKITLAFKLGHILDDAIAREFWRCLLLTRPQDVRDALPTICRSIKDRLYLLPDERSREVLGEGLDWVIRFPGCVQFVTEQKLAKSGHFPNLVGFSILLEGLQTLSKNYHRKVDVVIHDEQSEFGRSLRAMHSMFSNALPDVIEWVDASYSLQRLPGSRFEMKHDHDSAGIQIADVALWLYGQYLKGKTIPPQSSRLLTLILERGWHNDFSFEGVESSILREYGHIMFDPISPEQEETSRRMLIMAEERRRLSMDEYETNELPPFMRPIDVREDPEK